MAETHAPYPIFMLLRFHHWDDVLALPAPSPGMAMTNAFWRFASGFAFAAKAKLPLQKRNARFLRRRAKKHLQMGSAGDQTGGMPESAGRI